MAQDFTFTLPTDKEELIERFLSVSEGPQRLLLMAMTHGVTAPGQAHMGETMLTWLRTDERTRALVSQLESTPAPKLSKPKGGRRGFGRS
ncbi:hypothetical protein K7W42_17660 [Deinococcus sp. HMF7604]|uniref:hypothetical protein n=1 Tax=Deinococcus betulae TaxID=2873312 RepID=UPI001CCA8C51|nr:hypothetical protein [Deinococcus betulae]MBZ9752672.1 hypothetical protein [Deinococcus betulae]